MSKGRQIAWKVWAWGVALALVMAGAAVTVGSSPGIAEEAAAVYTCPMHPSVESHEPGKCPKCGMNLILKAPEKKAPPAKAPEKKAPPAKAPEKKAAPAEVAPQKPTADHSAHSPHASDATLYTCSMHPNVIQEGPGSCPVCGMDLVPIQRSSGASEGDEPVVVIDPVTVQNMGVRTAEVTVGEVWRTIRTVGEVKTPEDRIRAVNLRVSGWVDALFVEETGQRVQRGQALFRLYSPEVVAAQEEYLLAARAHGSAHSLTKAARRRLELMGIPAAHLDTVLEEGDGQKLVTFYAPSSGFVLHKNIVEGGRVDAGKDLYRIADLNQVWIEAEVYEFDAPHVRAGQKATVELPYEPGARRAADVAYVYPTLDPHTRTLRLRLVLDNPDGAILPGMFATVRLKAEPREGVLIVPAESILNTGERHLVFVSLSKGHFQAREVTLGLEGDDGRTEIKAGLSQGEIVVTSGQFLIDSEAQLMEAVQKMRAILQTAPGDGP